MPKRLCRLRRFLHVAALIALLTPCTQGGGATQPRSQSALPSGVTNPSTPTPTPLIVDTDMGIDDALALLYLLNDQKIQVQAILVDGNASCHCAFGINNVRKLLTLTHYAPIPIACGHPHFLGKGHTIATEIRQQSDTLLGLPLPDPDPRYTLSPKAAKTLLADLLYHRKTPTTLLTIGSLTTLAETLQDYPFLASKIDHLYIMGGAVHVPGNIAATIPGHPNTTAEWNIYFDPLASKRVFESSVPITLIPLDATNQAPLNMDFYERLRHANPSLTNRTLVQLLKKNMPLLQAEQWYFWDPLAATLLANPWLCQYETDRLTVKLKPEKEAGRLVNSPSAHPIQVCVKLDYAAFTKEFIQVVSQGANRLKPLYA